MSEPNDTEMQGYTSLELIEAINDARSSGEEAVRVRVGTREFFIVDACMVDGVMVLSATEVPAPPTPPEPVEDFVSRKDAALAANFQRWLRIA